ncbi:hypothetical protein VD0002_g6650 [Verticillium dahliae]|uniref:Uncharacterized protein n=1 Tax=Verticillium dahliae TaxID=27337 RepID=A0AA44WKJ9_VERDA|nr:hypothetical protein BJF96_g3494 [Verticillium dahliae]PNH38515.1 hypothetical protein VD0004_g8323 [Verticillium dahliae]PNH49366.1 hypothetical protein VD0003_g7774 [Verticillium dahliae]PNH61080.1 hypothetical protein VD0002_g6650 [Verticillium dahliae]PNH66530.1 hypothetical protein VD0001_g8122 [Verticillium dahliae]
MISANQPLSLSGVALGPGTGVPTVPRFIDQISLFSDHLSVPRSAPF